MSKTALAALFASSAVVAPIAASADTKAEAELILEYVYFEIDESVYKVSADEYSDYLIFGNEELAELLASNPIKSLEVNGKVVSLNDYSDALIFGDEFEELEEVTYSSIKEVEINENGTIDIEEDEQPEDRLNETLIYNFAA